MPVHIACSIAAAGNTRYLSDGGKINIDNSASLRCDNLTPAEGTEPARGSIAQPSTASLVSSAPSNASLMTLHIGLAKSPSVISPVLEMPAPWALLVWGIPVGHRAVPRTTAVYISKIAVATRFFDHHNRRLAPRITRCGGRRLRCNPPAQQWERYQRRNQKLSHGILAFRVRPETTPDRVSDL
jgi:hypothetical protein